MVFSPSDLSFIPTFSSGAPTFTTLHPSMSTVVSATPNIPVSGVPITLQNWSFPPKLVKKILNLEFVDMLELIPDSWSSYEEEPQYCHHLRPSQRRRPVNNILFWVEYYAAMAAILASKYPHKTMELMIYLRTIMKVHRSCVGDGWITYDIAYRRKAAASKSLDWSQVDFTLYNETFTGRVKSVVRCGYCSSESHSSQECSYALGGSTVNQNRTLRNSRLSILLCGHFNSSSGNQCRYRPCKFAHFCAKCHGPHPQSECHQRDPPLLKLPRQNGPRGKFN